LTDDYVHGQSPLDTHRLTRLDDDLYWHDGQMRGEVYDWGSFLQSKMYAQGVTCSDCHDPHSLKLKADGNAVCAQCHQPAKYDAPSHTHHALGTPGAACNCHMPATTYMVVDPRHDHSMRIPRPDQSVQLGTPNACANCHAKKSAQWAADAMKRGPAESPSGFQQFGQALHAGAAAAPGAREALVQLIDDPTQPAIARASAIDRLANLLTPRSTDAVVHALKDADASVRQAAVEALVNADPELRKRVLPKLLDDEVLAVRIEAARALPGAPERSLTMEQRARFSAVLDEYLAAQTYNFDRPEGHMNVGNLAVARGDAETAIAQYQQALAIDPLFVAAYVNLADVYRATGREVDAQVILRQGLKADPHSAVLHHTVGLALTRQKARDMALQEFKTAVQLAPNDGRFAPNAVALNDQTAANA
jgi:predicted CXXCH cytochrome family protein